MLTFVATLGTADERLASVAANLTLCCIRFFQVLIAQFGRVEKVRAEILLVFLKNATFRHDTKPKTRTQAKWEARASLIPFAG